MITYNFLVKKFRRVELVLLEKQGKAYDLYKTELSVSCFRLCSSMITYNFLLKKTILGISFTICQLFKSPGYCRGSYKKHIAVILRQEV